MSELKPISCRRVTAMLWMRLRASSEIVAPRFTPARWWECDVWRLTEAGFTDEFEIKLTVADFRKDFTKETWKRVPMTTLRGFDYLARTPEMERKHDLLAARDERSPNRFWFVLAEEVADKVEVPDYAGLLIARGMSRWPSLQGARKLEGCERRALDRPAHRDGGGDFNSTGGKAMHVAEVSEPVRWRGGIVEPGTYWLEDHNAAALLDAGGGYGAVRLVQGSCGREERPLAEAEELLAVRVGGFGDLLWLNAIYGQVRRLHPGLRIAHCCFPNYAPVLEGFVDEVVEYPLARERAYVRRGQSVVWLENAIEGEPCLEEHPTERLARRLGVPVPERLAAYHLRPEEREWAAGEFPRTGRRRVGVQVSSSSRQKTYPHILKVLPLLAAEGCELVLLGERRTRVGEPPREREGVYDCTQRSHGIRESIALLATCDVVLAADSVMVNAAGALDVPVVGIYGPFHGRSYMKGFRGRWIQGRLDCSPCSWHPRATEYPPDGPCAREMNWCCALERIEPEYVARQVMKLLA